MKLYKNRTSTEIFALAFSFIIFILSSSFTYDENLYFESCSEQIRNCCLSESISEDLLNSETPAKMFVPWSFTESSSAKNLKNALTGQFNKTNNVSTELNFAYPYFPLVYAGYGVDHMNINLVNLTLTGLIVGDEIGIFDGIYCVGSSVIEAKNISENSLSIPASSNENSETKPNGYIEGHKITIKTYRAGIIYLLYFQTVNNSTDIFEKGGSMFALVDFSRSEEQTSPEGTGEIIKIYPNPFETNIRIEVNLPKAQQLNCEIFDITGKLIKTLYTGLAEGQQLLIWDGKDNSMNQVSMGVYICRLNKSTIKIIYGK